MGENKPYMSENDKAGNDRQNIAANQANQPDEQGSPRITDTINSTATQPETREEAATREQNIEKRMSAFEKSMRCLTIAGIAIAILTGLIFAGQLYEMYSASRLDERAWVGVEKLSSVPDIPETGKSFDVYVLFRNSGKTPAINVRMWNTAVPATALPDVKETCTQIASRQVAKSLIAPNATLAQILHPSNSKPLGQGWDVDLANRGQLYVEGCVLYDDVFDHPHWLTYCGVLDLASRAFNTCEKYNDTGEGQYPN